LSLDDIIALRYYEGAPGLFWTLNAEAVLASAGARRDVLEQRGGERAVQLGVGRIVVLETAVPNLLAKLV
jgi:hypothetical protein